MDRRARAITGELEVQAKREKAIKKLFNPDEWRALWIAPLDIVTGMTCESVGLDMMNRRLIARGVGQYFIDVATRSECSECSVVVAVVVEAVLVRP